MADNRLSAEQMKIVSKVDGQMLCVACPGSGKTTVIVERVHHLIESGISPDSILVITFTKEAAKQMRERYERKFGNTTVFFGTIHSLCFSVIKKAYHYTAGNIILEREVYSFFYSILFHKVRTDNINEYIRNLIGEISYIRNRGIRPEDYTPEHSRKGDFCRAYADYQEFKQQNCKIDYDDMLWLCLYVFTRMPDELAFWRERYRYVMIDEYQDTNRIQAEIFYTLAGTDGNLCVVGDDDQSIYRFRAADSRVFLDFPQKYPAAEKFYLSTNYRSCPEIIAGAGMLIANNRQRFLKRFRGSRTEKGEMLVIRSDREAGCIPVIRKLSELIKEGVALDQMAVLYRTNSQGHPVAARLLKMNVPFYCTEPLYDFHRDFIFGDIMAYYRLANGIAVEGDIQRVLNRPNRFLATKDFEKCRFELPSLLEACSNARNQYQAKCRVREMYMDIQRMKGADTRNFFRNLELIGYMGYLRSHAAWSQKDPAALKEMYELLKNEALQFLTMEEWIDYTKWYAAMLQEKQKQDGRDGICLSTLHAAKGLEWKCVLIIDATDDVYPHGKAASDEDFEEERRLFYVGVTRARDRCYIFTTSESDLKSTPSRYLYEMNLLKKPD